MLALLAFLIGLLVGYNLAQYGTRFSPNNAAHAEIKVGQISKKEK